MIFVKLFEMDELPVDLWKIVTDNGTLEGAIPWTVGQISKEMAADLGVHRPSWHNNIDAIDNWLKGRGALNGEKVLLYTGKWHAV